MSKIIHFAYYEQPTEGNPEGYEGDAICGTQGMDPDATNHTVLVTCKKCLKKIHKAFATIKDDILTDAKECDATKLN